MSDETKRIERICLVKECSDDNAWHAVIQTTNPPCMYRTASFKVQDLMEELKDHVDMMLVTWEWETFGYRGVFKDGERPECLKKFPKDVIE